MNFAKIKILKLIIFTTIFIFCSNLLKAEHGVIEIAMRSTTSHTTQLVAVKAQIHKALSITIVNQKGESFNKVIIPTKQQNRMNFNLPIGTYKIVIAEIDSGIAQKYIYNFK